MLPRVILHNAVSADGRTTGFATDLGLFYRMAGRWHEDVTLAGSDTILDALRRDPGKAEISETSPPATDSADGGRLAVIDSRGRVKDWRRVKAWPFWRSFISIGSDATPGHHRAYLRYQDVEEVTAGVRQVDLELALHQLSDRYGATTVRVESGGTLNGALLRRGLVDEVSLVLHPVLVGGMSPHTIYRTLDLGPGSPIEMRLRDCEMLDGVYAWLRYEVAK